MAKTVDLKSRSPLTWLLLGLLVPFSLLYWIYKTNGQVNHLNQIRGSGRRVMNPWWLMVTTVVLGCLVSGLLLVLILLPDPDVSWGQELRWLVWPMMVAWMAWMALYIVYLLQYVEAVAALGASRQDKDIMIIMAILSPSVGLPFYLFVVYKSQVIIDQALAELAAAGSGPAAQLAP